MPQDHKDARDSHLLEVAEGSVMFVVLEREVTLVRVVQVFHVFPHCVRRCLGDGQVGYGSPCLVQFGM